MQFCLQAPSDTAPFLRQQAARAVPITRAEALRRQRTESIRHYVDQNLSDPELSARRAARALGMSVRSLHLALSGSGESFCQLLLRRRLELCCRRLRMGQGGSVADIAFGCGFNSLSSFYRAFRRICGASPSDLRQTGAHTGLALAA